MAFNMSGLDPAQMALGAGLLGGGTFGQAMERGLLGAQTAAAGADERSMRRSMIEAQVEQRRADAAKDRAALEAAQRKAAALGQWANGQLDEKGLVVAGFEPNYVTQLSGMGKQEVARSLKMMQGGVEVEQQYDKFGAPVGPALPQYKAPVQVNQGDRTTFLDGYTLQPKTSMAINQTADSKASSALGWANNALSRQRLALDQTSARAEGSTKGAPAGYRWKGDGTVEPIPGGPAGEAKPMTDVQAKALQFGSRMEASDQIINSMSKKGVNHPAAITSAVEGVPVIGGALRAGFNSLPSMLGGASQDQQVVQQAQTDWLTANLRKESGAVIGKDEIETGRRQYFPQIGDTPVLIAQKARNRALATAAVKAEVPKSAPTLQQLQDKASAAERTVVRTGTMNGRKVIQYSDGTTDYAN